MVLQKTQSTNYSVLVFVLSVAAPVEKACSMNDQPSPLESRLTIRVTPYWSSLTDSRGEEFELPTGITSCTVLKVRAYGELNSVDSRLGRFIVGGSFIIEDNFGAEQYSNGRIIQAALHWHYNGVSLYVDPPSHILSPNRLNFYSNRHIPGTILAIKGGGPVPLENSASYVCAFNFRNGNFLAYFLKKDDSS